MTDSTASLDPRVVAIRKDPKVGRGSASSVDECYTDEELLRDLDAAGIKGKRAAVRWAREGENIWIDQFNDINAAGGTGKHLDYV